jgi:hypothetical protein
VLDISKYASPAAVGHLNTPTSILSADAGGDYIFAAGEMSGLRLLDGSLPKLKGGVREPAHIGNWRDLAVGKNCVVSIDPQADLAIFNITNSRQVIKVRSFSLPGSPGEIEIREDQAYIFSDSSGFYVLDVENPSEPEIIGFLEIPGFAYGMDVSGDYAFISQRDDSGKMLVLDITDPENPRQAGYLKTSDPTYGLCSRGEYVFMAAGESGLRVAGIKNIPEVLEISRCKTPGFAYDTIVRGNYAYVADGSEGVAKIDISNLENPVVVKSHDTPGEAVKLFVYRDQIYVSDTFSLIILD